jgi:hypothetical protein
MSSDRGASDVVHFGPTMTRRERLNAPIENARSLLFQLKAG